jgi:hypothetical protein
MALMGGVEAYEASLAELQALNASALLKAWGGPQSFASILK